MQAILDFNIFHILDIGDELFVLLFNKLSISLVKFTGVFWNNAIESFVEERENSVGEVTQVIWQLIVVFSHKIWP